MIVGGRGEPFLLRWNLIVGWAGGGGLILFKVELDCRGGSLFFKVGLD